MSSLTDKTLSGFIWAFGERFGVQLMQLVIFIVLARILTPEAFGLIGMLAVFIAVSQSLTDSGFSQALIQKKGADEIHFSTVFYINLVVSVIIYGLLFTTAPLIASFYGEPILIELIRVLGLRFIVSSFSMVHIAKMVKEVKFKELMIAKLPSTLLGGAAGIGAAYLDFGVWSLVIQQLTDIMAYSIQVWIQSDWIPKFVFNMKKAKELFDFGSKMMISEILKNIYDNIYEIIIGRFYSPSQVGFFTQANKIKQLPVQNISSTLNRVTFPVLSDIQDDDKRLKKAYGKINRQVLLLTAPLMIGAIVIAEPLFRFVLTEKWLPAVPYFQWLCISGLIYPLNAFNVNILKVKGRSDLYLKLRIVKIGLESLGLFLLIEHSVLALVIFKANFSFFLYFMNSYYGGKFIHYGITEQLSDIWKIIFSAIIMGFIVWTIFVNINTGDLITIALCTTIGLLVYLSIIFLVENKMFNDTLSLIKKYL